MTRDGLIEVNETKETAERVSNREKDADFSRPQEQPTGRKKQRMKQPEQPAAAQTPERTDEPVQESTPQAVQDAAQLQGVPSAASPLPSAPELPHQQDTGAAERVMEHIDAAHTRKASKKAAQRAQREAAAKEKSSRLQFTDEELATPELEKYVKKSNEAADRLDAARAAIPKEKKLIGERTFDEATGKGKTRLRFEEREKPINGGKSHSNPLSRPAQEAGVFVHNKIHSVEKDNSGVEGAHKSEELAERGAAFVLVYLIFLVLLGLPIMVMEFAVGRASQKSAARSFHVLEPAGTKWHLQGYACMAGNYLLMMFYTTVGGWMAAYIFKTLTGEFKGLDSDGVAAVFNDMLARPGYMTFWMVLVVLLSFFICSLGLQKGVERITKAMMSCLFLILLILCIRSVTLPGASEGLRFYLIPDFTRFTENGVGNTIFAAMGQAFFTLSLGIGAMAIFGSYIGKDHTLTGETINICLLDTLVAFLAGLIIFPSCFAFGVDPGQGPGLVFITLPNIFNQMVGGRIFGVLFFVFMTFAAQSTIIAVFENIISFSMDLFGTSRKKTVLINGIAIILLSLPCVFGFNIWSGFQPMGAGSTIQDLEDFIVSNNLLPLGSMVYLLFCTSRYGWGWKNFLAEADTGKGVKFPAWARVYVSYILPLIVLFIFIMGYYQKFK